MAKSIGQRAMEQGILMLTRDLMRTVINNFKKKVSERKKVDPVAPATPTKFDTDGELDT